MEVNVKELQKAVEQTHGGKATFIESVLITEFFKDSKVWEGAVHVFDLEGHPKAKKCYAWSHETEGGKRKFYAVLHSPPINSAKDAVRAAIVQDYKSNTK